jgi:hypothetical protein
MSYEPEVGEVVTGVGRSGKPYVGAFRQHAPAGREGESTLTLRGPNYSPFGGGARVFVRTDTLAPTDQPVNCELCGELEDDETGQFWDKIGQRTVVAHAQCGIDAGYDLA